MDTTAVETSFMLRSRQTMRARVLATTVVVLLSMLVPLAARAATDDTSCTHPVLILAAMPLELNPLVAAAHLDPARTFRLNDRTFYRGKLGGSDVVLALSGVGITNAARTTTMALEHFSCGFRAVMFSGVAGSVHRIGDVVIPRLWTKDGGKSFTGVDQEMLRVAHRLSGSTKVKMAQDVPVGDAACACPGVDAATPIHMSRPPAVWVGGRGHTAGGEGPKPARCIPGGGDIEGCEPCIIAPASARDAGSYAAAVPEYIDPSALRAITDGSSDSPDPYDSQDEETAAVDVVAKRYHVPFLGVRGVSDGAGDPLGLPGFPVQFFVYRPTRCQQLGSRHHRLPSGVDGRPPARRDHLSRSGRFWSTFPGRWPRDATAKRRLVLTGSFNPSARRLFRIFAALPPPGFWRARLRGAGEVGISVACHRPAMQECPRAEDLLRRTDSGGL